MRLSTCVAVLLGASVQLLGGVHAQQKALDSIANTLDNAQCQPSLPCTACRGLNAFDGSKGICEDGKCFGLPCASVCGATDGPCNQNGCAGRAVAGSLTKGICLGGDYRGCSCTMRCPDNSLFNRFPSCGDCNGVSDPDGGSKGVCGAGSDLAGCPCQSTCSGSDGSCAANGCAGISDPTGGAGQCLDGKYRGCRCKSTCSGSDGSCGENGCEGINDPDGNPGVCTAGDSKGCHCKSTCGSKPGPCQDNGCAGVPTKDGKGVCTAGKFRGCTCTAACGDKPGPCDQNGCAGLNAPDGSNGICTDGAFIGCSCTSKCGKTNGKCNQNGCDGSHGVCTKGAYIGCKCES